MPRICELPPVIMVQLHNEVYSLDVWTLWSTVLQACSAPPLKTDIMQKVVPSPVVDTNQEAL